VSLYTEGPNNICISTDILWRALHILTEPIPYTIVSVNRNKE